MKSRVWFVLLLLSSVPLWASVQWALGPGGGLALPLGGNIGKYQPALGGGFDVRITGFQPVLGFALTGNYARFKGPSSSDPLADSSKFAYQYVPAALCLFTDFSPLIPGTPIRPYLRTGLGPCYWDLRYGGQLLPTLDTSTSKQLDCVITGAIGAEYRLPRLPVALFAEFTADYITSTHFEKYYYLDKDEYFALAGIGIRYLFR